MALAHPNSTRLHQKRLHQQLSQQNQHLETLDYPNHSIEKISLMSKSFRRKSKDINFSLWRGFIEPFSIFLIAEL